MADDVSIVSTNSANTTNTANTSAISQVSGTSSSRPRRRRKKETKIVIKLWVNRVSYDHGLLCTFCIKTKATAHCPDCKDFLCDSCDLTVHSHSKRSWHNRTILSLLTMDQAAERCTRAMRFLSHLKLLQRLARQKIRRLYDSKTFCHYYYNTVYGTTSWRKPYCIRTYELFPFLTPDEAAARIQGMHRSWIARIRVYKKIFKQYRKVFHRMKGLFYYAYIGKSTILQKQSWKKPCHLNFRGFPTDIPPVQTDDVFAITIQRKWRAVLVRKFLKAVVRQCMDRVWDPISGRFTYINRNDNTVSFTKPLILGNEDWDLRHVPDWDVDRVVLFFRRLGLRIYTDTVRKYNLDGNMLLLFQQEDFEALGIVNRIHIKKVLLELERVYPSYKRDRMNALVFVRREKIRRHKLFDDACIKIQRVYRGHLGRKHFKYVLESSLLLQKEKGRMAMVVESGRWWTEPRSAGSSSGAGGGVSLLTPTGQRGGAGQGKQFGRRSDHLSVRGWGRWEGNVWLSVEDSQHTDNPTRRLTEKLARSGYDFRRQHRFINDSKVLIGNSFARNIPPPSLPVDNVEEESGSRTSELMGD